MKKYFLTLFLIFSFRIFIYPVLYTGDLGFSFMNIPVDPMSLAYSTTSASVVGRTGDLINPASLNLENKNSFFFAYMPFLVSSHFGIIGYTFSGSQVMLKYFNSGSMERRDSLNTDLGEFFSSDILLEYSKSFKMKDNLRFGAGINFGMENVLDYNALISSFSFGIIYEKVYDDFLNIGCQILNLGAGYDFEKISPTPAKFIVGLSVSKDDMPFSVNFDVGKILDRKYFYSFALKFSIVKPTVEPTVENLDNNILKDEPDKNESSTDFFTDSMKINLTYDQLKELQDTSVADSIKIDTIRTVQLEEHRDSSTIDSTKLDTLTIDKTDNQNYTSYSDFLEQENKEKSQTQIQTKTLEDNKLPEKKMGKKNIFSPLKLDLILGISSDRTELQLGYATDLTSALTAGFLIGYNNISILWSSKFWGELGISQSIGMRLSF